MRTSARSIVATPLVLLGLLAGHAAPAETKPAAPREVKPAPAESFAGVTFRLVEEQARRQYEIGAGTTTEVDFQSTLFIRFDPPSLPEGISPPSVEWRAVQKSLASLNQMANEYAALNLASVDINDPGEVLALRRRITAHDANAIEMLLKSSDLAAQLGKSDREFVRLLRAGEEGSPDGKPPVYENLAQFLAKAIAQLQDRTGTLSEKAQGYEVTVTALHQPRGRENQAIHVDPYDNLPAGQLEPANPLEAYGVRMTAGEMADFRMSLKMNEQAAEAIREVRQKGKTIQLDTSAFARNLTAKLKKMVMKFAPEGAEPVVLRTKLTMLMEELNRFAEAANTPADAAASAKAIHETLQTIHQDLGAVADVFKQVESLEIRLTSAQSTSLSQFLLDDDGIVKTLAAIARRMDDLGKRSAKWQQHLEVLGKNGPIVAKELGQQQVIGEIENYVNAMKRDLPELAGLLQDSLSAISHARGVVEAGQILSEVEFEQTWHAINTEAPPTGMIDLRCCPLDRREIVTIKVQFRSKKPDGTEKIEHTTTYRLEIQKLDLHASATASLIFARAQSGTEEATDWQPNVAGLLNWYYRIREPDAQGERLWNWLEPGAGVHVASLDQGDDTIEFGLGVNLALWNGLLNAGYGFNLSQEDDREYYFVGLNLLHLLDIGRDVTSGTPTR